MNNTALKPTIFNIDAFKEESEVSKINDEEQFLYSLSKQKGWDIIVEFKKRVFKELDEVNKADMSNGMSFEEIGKNAVVINLAESVVDRILDKVNDAKEACESNGK